MQYSKVNNFFSINKVETDIAMISSSRPREISFSYISYLRGPVSWDSGSRKHLCANHIIITQSN